MVAGTVLATLLTASAPLPTLPAAPGAPDRGALPAAAADTVPAAAAPTGAAHAPPAALTLPGHFTDVPVDPVGTARDGALDVPGSPRRLGWWALGARPGAPHGTVLLAGHLDTADEGVGPFEELHAVPLGAPVRLTTADGTHHAYRIVARRTYRKDRLPPDLFSAHGTPRLALITCAGAFDPEARAYAGNLVLYATPVRAPVLTGR
ncbi:class F sortase [Streptomyces sp. NPDC047928]|uniref:class F sortase n=1 Tax=unclassified Streptomyces TaxID=2593676 RepID=UPI0037141973